MSFTNKRSQCYWEFREALDPTKDSQIALPPDPRLLAGLTAPTFTIEGIKIKAEPKDKVKDKLGYSPDEADAVVMAWYGGRRGIIPETMKRPNFKHNNINKPVDRYAGVRQLIKGI